MKYLKSFEKQLKYNDPIVLNHPLYELSQLLKNIMTELKNIDNHTDSNITYSFSNKVTHKSITISYMQHGWTLLNIELVKFNSSELAGMTIKSPSYFEKDYNMTSEEYIKILNIKLKNYYKSKIKGHYLFNFNIKDLNDIMNILNDTNIIHQLQINKDTKKFNL